jgi:hypothetical protein
LLIGLNALLLHFLHLTFPSAIFLASALVLLEQSLHTKTFLYNLAIAAGIFVAIFQFTVFLFYILNWGMMKPYLCLLFLAFKICSLLTYNLILLFINYFLLSLILLI